MLDQNKDPLGDFLKDMDLPEDAASLEQQKQAAYDSAVLIATAFMGQAGQNALLELRRLTIEQPCFIPGMGADAGFAREGQNSLVRHIENCIKVAERGPPGAVKQEPARAKRR